MTSTVPHFSTIDINTQDIAILRSLADNVGAQVLPLIDAAVDSISLTADAKAPSHRPLCRTRGMRFLGPVPIRYRRVIQRSHIGVAPLRLVTKARDMCMFETTTSACALDARGFLKHSMARVRHIIRQAVSVLAQYALN